MLKSSKMSHKMTTGHNVIGGHPLPCLKPNPALKKEKINANMPLVGNWATRTKINKHN